MLTIDRTLATITAVGFGKEKTADARRKYKIKLAIALPAEVIADLSPDPEFTGTFWNGNGEPQLSNLYPLHINEPIRNVRAKFHDRIKAQAGLEIDGADITSIAIEPRAEGRALVEMVLEGIHEHGPIDAGDRLWRMIGVPTEIELAARQYQIDTQ